MYTDSCLDVFGKTLLALVVILGPGLVALGILASCFWIEQQLRLQGVFLF